MTGAVTALATQSVQRAYEVGLAGSPEAVEAANIAAEIEVAEAQPVVADLVLRAMVAFDCVTET